MAYRPTHWYVSDTHFSHKAEFLWKNRGYSSWEEHDECLIDYWNDTIRTKDKVTVAGDFCFQQGTRLDFIAPRLNGNKTLILGNHEHHNMEKYTKYFSKIHSVLITKRFIISHVPVHPHELQVRSDENVQLINLHGHLHKNETVTGKHHLGENYYNLNLELNNMEFIHTDTLSDYYEKIYGQ